MKTLQILKWVTIGVACSMGGAQAAVESTGMSELGVPLLLKGKSASVKHQTVGLTHTVSQGRTIDVNTASVQQLMSIKGIGKKTAERILEERKRAGLFISFEDLRVRVKGMSKKKLLKLHMQGLRVGNSTLGEDDLNLQNSRFPAPIQEDFSRKRIMPRIAEGQILQIKTPQ